MIQSTNPLHMNAYFQIVFRSSSRNVDVSDHLQDIEVTGSFESIQTWARHAFTNPE